MGKMENPASQDSFFNPVSLKNLHRMFFLFQEIKKILA